MSYKTPAVLVTALVALAAAAPVASATVTPAPLTIAQSGSDILFTIAAPGESPTPDRLISLLVAPAGVAASTFAASMQEGVGGGASQNTTSTAACQVVNGPGSTGVELPEPTYSDGTGFTYTIPASILPASFDAKAVIVDDLSDGSPDTCRPTPGDAGIATTMADAARFPVPPPVVAPIAAPAPAPVVIPAPVVVPPKPAPVVAKDGIKSDWIVGGKPVAAPKAAKVLTVKAHSATLTLPKAPAGATIRVYRRVVGTKTFRVVKVTVSKKKGTATMSGLKPHTRYELKVVAVNKAGKQTNASKSVTVKTPKS
jgi:hypothetical protein